MTRTESQINANTTARMIMSNNSDLVAKFQVTNEYYGRNVLESCAFVFCDCGRSRFVGVTLARCNLSSTLARWSDSTRMHTLLKPARDLARDLVRTRANGIFDEYCRQSTDLLENRGDDTNFWCWCARQWQYNDRAALTPDARLLREVALTFEDAAFEFDVAGQPRKRNNDITNVCDTVTDAAMREVTARVLASDDALQDAATACKKALQKATREVASEYERDAMLATALRRRGIAWHTARNWIVPLETEASHYFVDSSGSISWRD